MAAPAVTMALTALVLAVPTPRQGGSLSADAVAEAEASPRPISSMGKPASGELDAEARPGQGLERSRKILRSRVVVWHAGRVGAHVDARVHDARRSRVAAAGAAHVVGRGVLGDDAIRQPADGVAVEGVGEAGGTAREELA